MQNSENTFSLVLPLDEGDPPNKLLCRKKESLIELDMSPTTLIIVPGHTSFETDPKGRRVYIIRYVNPPLQVQETQTELAPTIRN
jgi:hypothetical protein